MPWSSVSEAEKSVPGIKNLSAKGKRAWLSAFNSCHKDKGDSKSCYAIAYAAAKGASKSAGLMMYMDDEDDDVEASGCPCWADERIAEELVGIAEMLIGDE